MKRCVAAWLATLLTSPALLGQAEPNAAKPTTTEAPAEAKTPPAPKAASTPALNPAPAPAPTSAISEARLAKLTPGGAPACEIRAQLEHSGYTYVACGEAGVWVLELAADPQGDRLLERHRTEGRAVDLFMRGGRVWVELLTSTARPVDSSSLMAASEIDESASLAPMPPFQTKAAPKPPGRETPPPRAPTWTEPVELATSGRVLSSAGGQVVIDLGRSHGVEPGDHIEFAVSERELGPLGNVTRREVRAVGRVSSATDEQALVELGLGEDVPVGAEATATEKRLTSNRSGPPRVAGVWSYAATARLFFVLDELGAGGLNEFAIGYQSESQLRYQFIVSPFGLAVAEGGRTFAGLAVGMLSYDTRLFEIGLGFGAQTVNDGDYEPGSGLTVAQSLRFGSLDGLHFGFRNDIALFHSEFEYSAFTGQAQIPVADRGWLLMGGGGGTVGYGFFEMGARLLVTGNGTRGSLFVRGTIGYASLFENSEESDLVFDDTGFLEGSFGDLTYSGPLIGVGLEWRQ